MWRKESARGGETVLRKLVPLHTSTCTYEMKTVESFIHI